MAQVKQAESIHVLFKQHIKKPMNGPFRGNPAKNQLN